MSQLSDEIARFLDGDRPDASAGLRFAAGALIGAVLAAFTPILLGLWAFQGPEIMLRRGGLVRVDLLSLLYPLGAVVSGGLFFLLTWLAPNRPVRALLGAAAVSPWFAAIALCIDRGYAAWQGTHTATTLLCTLGIGAPLGWLSHRRAARRSERPTGRPAV